MLRHLRHKAALFLHHMREMERLKDERAHLEEQNAFLHELLSKTEYLPVPPARLMKRIGGQEDSDHYLGVGRKILWDIKMLLRDAGQDLSACKNILDFGCGCGRVARFLSPTHGQSVTGVDIDAEAIEWCAKNLAVIGTFQAINHMPPLPFPDNHFDGIYCISVFTHLPEDMQNAWLQELHRVMARKGVFVTSLHTAEHLPPGEEAAAEHLKKEGFVYIERDPTEGLPDFYKAAFHTPAYIQKKWGEIFRVRTIRSRAINNHQTGVVCQKK